LAQIITLITAADAVSRGFGLSRFLRGLDMLDIGRKLGVVRRVLRED
jgi:hypothetical protein